MSETVHTPLRVFVDQKSGIRIRVLGYLDDTPENRKVLLEQLFSNQFVGKCISVNASIASVTPGGLGMWIEFVHAHWSEKVIYYDQSELGDHLKALLGDEYKHPESIFE